MHGHSPPNHQLAPDGPDRPWGVLLLMCVAQFMVILDITVVNVALPAIGDELRFAGDELQWVVAAYVLFTGGLLLLGGRMADLLDRRLVFVAGLAVFSAASLASGLAASPEVLIAARAAQGVGAAMLSPAALSIITTTYSGAQRTRALSAWGAIGAGGAAAGVLLGGVLTTWLSWEWIFFVNVPVGLSAVLAARRIVPRGETARASLHDLDLPGALTLVAGLVALVYAVEWAANHGWGSAPTLALLPVSAGLLAGFAAIERGSSRPLVPAATWRARSLVSGATVMLGATGLLVGTFFLNSLFLQGALGWSALETGLAFLPLVGVIGIAAHLGHHLLARVGPRGTVAGALILVAGGYLLLSRAGAEATYAVDLLPGFLLVGLGVGVIFVAVSVTAMSDVEHERAGLASGVMTTAHELGGAFGVAMFSAVALGSGDAANAGVAAGYGDGALAGAALAGLLALVAALAMPASRRWQLRLLAVDLSRRVVRFLHLFPPAGGPDDLF